MLSLISAALLAALFPPASPGVNNVDAALRAGGNRKAAAVAIGRSIFAVEWPAQVLNVYVDGIDDHAIAGLRVSGVHFHHPLTREDFIAEVAALIQRAFRAAPVEEVDVWTTVPLNVGKGIVVSGDIAKPTSRTVFTVSVRRSENATSLAARVRAGRGIFWDQEWARAALK